MARFFEKRDRWGHGMALWVLLGMVFLVPFAVWSLGQIKLRNDVHNWLPKDDPQSQILTWYTEQFPVENRVLLSWKDSSLSDPRVWRLAEKLEGTKDEQGQRHGGSPYVKAVATPQEAIKKIQEISRDGVSTSEAIVRLEGVLVGTGKLKIELTAEGLERQKTVERLIVEKARKQLGIELIVSKRQKDFAEDESIGEFTDRDAQMVPEGLPEVPKHHLQVSWRGMNPDSETARRVKEIARGLRGRKTEQHPDGGPLVQSAFFFPGAPVALYVSLSEAGEKEPRKAFAAIREIAESVGIPEEDLHMGGRSVAGTELNTQVKKAGWNLDYPIWQIHKRSPLLLSLLVGVVLSFVMLRSFRLATLVLIISNYTVLITVALVPITHGSMNMVLVVMPTLLCVLTMSAAIHMANYWKHAAVRDMRTAIVEAIKMARTPCLLASITTAIGLLSLFTSPLKPVRDFGVYSAIGCLLSLFAVLVCLPALLQFWPAKQPKHREMERRSWRWLAGKLVKYWIPVSALSLVAFAVCTYGLKWFRTETKVIRYFPEDDRVVQDYRFLEDNLAGIIPFDVIVRFDKTMQKEVEGPESDGDDEKKLDILQRMEIVRAIGNKLRKHPEISGVVSIAAFRPTLPENPDTTSVKYRRTKHGTFTETRTKGSKANSFVAVAKSEKKLTLENGREFHVEKGDELWRITAQVAVMSDANYGDLTDDVNDIIKSTLKNHPGADHVVTGMVPVFLRTQEAVLESLIKSFVLAFIVIAIVMMVVLRNPIAGLMTMLPNLLPVGIVFGLISWFGLAVDIGTMITASVALGIAVDGTLHLLTWFRDGIEHGYSRTEAIENALSHCGPAMWQTSAAVGIGLLMLAPADLLLIHRFGWLMAALIGAALVADIIFLPALLAGPLGHIMERSIRKSRQTDKAEPAAEHTAEPASAEPHIVRMQPDTGRILRMD